MTKGKITVENNKVIYEGEECHGVIVDRILAFVKEQIDATPLLNFLEKLMSNPSKNCVDQLYQFLEHKNLPIDPDGDFYAYKAVRSNWMDKHTGTIRNKIGDIVEIKRNKVDDNPRNDCSYGLHVGSIEYVRSFGSADDKYLIVKVNPADAVAVPSYDTKKMRCCRYEVVEEFIDVLPETVYTSAKENDKELNIVEQVCEECDELLINCECGEDEEFCDECGFDIDTCQCNEEDDEDDEELEAASWTKKSLIDSAKEMSRTELKEEFIRLDIYFDNKTNTESLRKKLIKYLS